MKVAVTGASGFVGRHVLAELRKYDVEIVAISRDATRLNDLGRDVHVVEMDIAGSALDSFNILGKPDVLIHLAWDGLPNYKSLHHFETELPRHYQFLKNMVESGLASMIITGTCFEYGMQSGMLSETMPTKPTNPYGYAKDSLRQQLEYLKTIMPFNLTWGRLFYMYGEGQPNSSLYPMLKAAVSRGEKIFNMSGGEQLRDYLPVVEVSRKIVQLAMKPRDMELVNICSGKPISVRRLVEQWLSENNWNIKLNLGYHPYPEYEPMAFWGELSNYNKENLLK